MGDGNTFEWKGSGGRVAKNFDVRRETEIVRGVVESNPFGCVGHSVKQGVRSRTGKGGSLAEATAARFGVAKTALRGRIGSAQSHRIRNNWPWSPVDRGFKCHSSKRNNDEQPEKKDCQGVGCGRRTWSQRRKNRKNRPIRGKGRCVSNHFGYRTACLHSWRRRISI